MRRTALLLALLLVAGCGGSSHKQGAPLPSPAVQTRVTGDGGGTLLDVSRSGGTTTITSSLGGEPVTIKGTGDEYTENGRPLAVVKADSGDIKLKDAAGRTLWRLKIASDKVKVRKGESDERYTLKTESADRVKVKQGDKEIGNVRKSGSGAVVKTADGHTVARTATYNGNALALLLCTEIPSDLRALLTVQLSK